MMCHSAVAAVAATPSDATNSTTWMGVVVQALAIAMADRGALCAARPVARGPDGGCSQSDLRGAGGNGYFYCFAANEFYLAGAVRTKH
jgi:hypothetical protein